jgi:hypothetical protein
MTTDPKLIIVGLAALSLLATGVVPSSAIAGKVIFQRSKPHVNAGPATEMTAAAPTVVAKRRRAAGRK